MIKCELIKNGRIIERFFKDGSVDEIKKGLEMFEWPDGTWRFTEESEVNEI